MDSDVREEFTFEKKAPCLHSLLDLRRELTNTLMNDLRTTCFVSDY